MGSPAFPWRQDFGCSPLLVYGSNGLHEPDHDRVRRTECPALHRRARVGPHWAHRLRWPARPYCAASEALRRRTSLVERTRVRGGHFGDQPVAGSCLNTARNLLRLEAPRTSGRSHRWHLLHRPRACDHLGPFGSLPGNASASLGSWRCCWGRCRCTCGCPECRSRSRPRQLEKDRRCACAESPLALLFSRRRRFGGHDRSLPGRSSCSVAA